MAVNVLPVKARTAGETTPLEVESALVAVLEFCRAADKLGLKRMILGLLDLSDAGFQKHIDVLEELLEHAGN